MNGSSLPEKQTSFRWTKSPNPEWKIGDGLGDDTQGARQWREDEAQGWKDFDPEVMDKLSLYRLMTGGVAPRPIAFVSSLSEAGVGNLAPFSWFQMIAHRPPIIMISVSQLGTGYKDTVNNIKSTNGFTVNIISEPWIEAANFACVDAPPGVSEWPGTGLRKAPSTLVKAPWVRESAFAMECEVYSMQDIPEPEPSGKVGVTLVFGVVKLIHVRNAVLAPDNTVDPALFKPIGRLTGNQYATLGEGFIIPRDRWVDVKDTVAALDKKE